MSKSYVTDCDYCGEIALVTEDGYGGKGCRCCLNRIEENDRRAESDDDFDFVMDESEYNDHDFQRDNWPE